MPNFSQAAHRANDLAAKDAMIRCNTMYHAIAVSVDSGR